MRDINLTLSTSEANNHVGQIVVRQDDENTQKITANITENGKPKSLAGLTVFFNAMIDDAIVARDLATIEDSSKVSYVFKSAFYQHEGRIKAFFTFERGNQRESTADFVYFVTRGNCRNIKQGNYIYEFENLKGVVGDIIGSSDLLPLIKKIDEVQGSVDSYRTETNDKMTSLKNDVDKKVTDHKNDTNNPHKTTPAKIGTLTKNEIETYVNQRVIKKKYLYNGWDSEDGDTGRYFGGDNEFKYKLEKGQVFVKVKMIWSRHNRDTDSTEPFGYYSFEYDSANFRGGSYYAPLITTEGDIAVKRVYVTSDKVAGHEHNYSDEQCKKFKLRRVVLYYYET